MRGKRRLTEALMWALAGVATLTTAFFLAFDAICEDDWCLHWNWFALPSAFAAVAGVVLALLVRRHRRHPPPAAPPGPGHPPS